MQHGIVGQFNTIAGTCGANTEYLRHSTWIREKATRHPISPYARCESVLNRCYVCQGPRCESVLNRCYVCQKPRLLGDMRFWYIGSGLEGFENWYITKNGKLHYLKHHQLASNRSGLSVHTLADRVWHVNNRGCPKLLVLRI